MSTTYDMTPLLRGKEVGRLLAMRPRDARRLLEKGGLPVIQVGPRAWRVRASAFQNWLGRQQRCSQRGRGDLTQNERSPAAPGPGGEAESVSEAPQGSVSGPRSQLNDSYGHVDRGSAEVVRIGTELEVCDDAIDAVIRRYFLPLPVHVSIRDQAGLDWIRVRVTSPSRVVELVEHHLRGRPLERRLLFSDYHGVIDWPVTLGITAADDRILPMPTRTDLERRGMLEDVWLPPDRVGRLQVDTVLGVSVSQPTDAEQAVLAQMQPRSGFPMSITPINMGREFRVEVSLQARDDTHLALLRAGMRKRPVRLFGKHTRMGTMLFDEFVFTDALNVSIDGVDVPRD